MSAHTINTQPERDFSARHHYSHDRMMLCGSFTRSIKELLWSRTFYRGVHMKLLTQTTKLPRNQIELRPEVTNSDS